MEIFWYEELKKIENVELEGRLRPNDIRKLGSMFSTVSVKMC